MKGGFLHRHRYSAFILTAGIVFALVFDVFTMTLRLWVLVLFAVGPNLAFLLIDKVARRLFKAKR